MNVKDLLNAGFGLLNPIRDTLVGKNFDTSNVKALDAVVKSTENSFAPNATLGSGPYVGICLRVDGFLNEGTPDPSNWATVVNESITKNNQSEAPRLLQIRVRIPEIHSSLPIPNSLPSPTEKSSDHGIINLYPVYIAKDVSVSQDIPQAGDMVWVDYQNTNTLEGPLYLGRVTNNVGVNGNVSTSGRQSFAKTCTQTPAIIPPQTQPVAASNSATDPLQFSQVDLASYSPKPTQPQQKSSVSLCGGDFVVGSSISLSGEELIPLSTQGAGYKFKLSTIRRQGGAYYFQPIIANAVGYIASSYQRRLAELGVNSPHFNYLILGDGSAKGGGDLPPHRSHKTGEDIDIGTPWNTVSKSGSGAILNKERFQNFAINENNVNKQAFLILMEEIFRAPDAVRGPKIDLILISPAFRSIMGPEIEAIRKASSSKNARISYSSEYRGNHFHLRFKTPSPEVS
jgi:murein endopeptidase